MPDGTLVPVPPALATGLTGFAAGLALIVAIGAQNAFVLRQGLRREHVGAVVAVCLVADVLLIAAGTLGIGAVVERAPVMLDVLRWAGAAYLLWFAISSFRSAVPRGWVRARKTIVSGNAVTFLAAAVLYF